ncbi:S8 family serine peptidase [Microcoleus sp. FACHB-1515]|uniref:S8 family serine peptidase n=1 Tax=Cyanophyceae TaxID=3028117 RepID=UPI001681E59B|nr:S8 family serine peptidase [Microcoleus sp. FACHB-1515]MBD2090684.1 S8 family serine peptidase [Microcoleus sp. FACHB-1515]
MVGSTPEGTPLVPGVLAEQEGVILQRGGEELAIDKLSDRFTVRLMSEMDLESLTAVLGARSSRAIPGVDLVAVQVESSQLDATMQRARSLSTVAFASHVYQLRNSPDTFVYLTDEVTVQFNDRVAKQSIGMEMAQLGLQAFQQVEGVPQTFIFRVTSQAQDNPIKLANQLMRRADVLLAEPNIVVRQELHYRPRDPLYAQQWYLNHGGGQQLAAGSHIFAEAAWEITRGNRSIVIAIADDAIDLNHPDFQGKGKIVAPRDLKGRDAIPLPEQPGENHGTACAGVAVAEENGVGIVGVAPGCALLPIRTTGFLDDSAVEQVFNWAIEQGASVISCSWGPSAVYFPLSLRQRAAITRAATQGRNGKGCVVVFAAGNANRPINGSVNEQGWQANVIQGVTTWLNGFAVHPDVMTVAATTSLGKKAAYSNWGAGIAIAAPSNNAPPGLWLQRTGYTFSAPVLKGPFPGRGVVTTDRVAAPGYSTDSFTADFGGTSSACPVVAGVAALMLSANPDLTAAEVKQIMQSTADKLIDADADPQLGLAKGTYDSSGYSQWFGFGKVNAARAVQAAQSRIAPAPIATRQVQGLNSQAIDIPDYEPQGATSSISITDSGNLRDIQVTIDVEHSFLGDVSISLIAPNGAIVLLQGRTLGRSTRLQTTYTLQTTPMLRQFLNRSISGRWQVRLVDAALLNVGRLRGWQIVLGV